MALGSGTKLGRYEIRSQIGAGGMGGGQMDRLARGWNVSLPAGQHQVPIVLVQNWTQKLPAQ